MSNPVLELFAAFFPVLFFIWVIVQFCVFKNEIELQRGSLQQLSAFTDNQIADLRYLLRELERQHNSLRLELLRLGVIRPAPSRPDMEEGAEPISTDELRDQVLSTSPAGLAAALSPARFTNEGGVNAS